MHGCLITFVYIKIRGRIRVRDGGRWPGKRDECIEEADDSANVDIEAELQNVTDFGGCGKWQ